MTATSGDSQTVSQADARPAFRAQVDFFSALARSLHEVGLPAHFLEDALDETAKRCGTPVQVFSMPTALWMSVADGDALPTALLLRVQPSAVHLERLARLSKIVDRIAIGRLSTTDATAEIDAVMQAPPRWGKPATVLAYLLSAAAFAVFFGGGMKEVVTAMAVGLAVGLISIGVREGRVSRRLFELGAAAAAATIANVAYLTTDAFVEWIPLASGLIILLPGLALVDAVEELAHGHLSSGSARLSGVGVVLLAMTFGAVLGLTLVPPTPADAPATTVEALPGWLIVPAVFAVAVGSTIRFRTQLEDVWIALAASIIALAGARLGKEWLGDFAGPFVAAFLLGLAANLFANLSRQPPQLFTVPGLALLVPGSFGVQSISALLSEDTLVGVDTAFHMFLTAMALVTGLLLSNSLYRQQKR